MHNTQTYPRPRETIQTTNTPRRDEIEFLTIASDRPLCSFLAMVRITISTCLVTGTRHVGSASVDFGWARVLG